MADDRIVYVGISDVGDGVVYKNRFNRHFPICFNRHEERLEIEAGYERRQ